MLELTLVYHEEMQRTPESPKGAWVARFRSEGLTAYGSSITEATDKLLDMLKTKRALEK